MYSSTSYTNVFLSPHLKCSPWTLKKCFTRCNIFINPVKAAQIPYKFTNKALQRKPHSQAGALSATYSAPLPVDLHCPINNVCTSTPKNCPHNFGKQKPYHQLPTKLIIATLWIMFNRKSRSLLANVVIGESSVNISKESFLLGALMEIYCCHIFLYTKLEPLRASCDILFSLQNLVLSRFHSWGGQSSEMHWINFDVDGASLFGQYHA